MDFNNSRLLQYAEYNDCFHVKICMKDGKYYRCKYLDNITLKSDRPLRIGIDQSSSQTGLAVKKDNGELLCLIDFVNNSRVNYGIFKSMLGLKLEQIFSKTTTEIIVLEKMWGGNKDSYEMLTGLAKYIESFKYIIEGWTRAEIAEILPNVWRSSYLDSPEYKGMFTKDKVKLAAVQEGVKRYSQLREYGFNNLECRHYNDSFDALGIIEGYEDKTFSSDGEIRKVSNTIKPTNHDYSYEIQFDRSGDLTTREDLGIGYIPERKRVVYEYNNDFTFHENVRRVTSVTNQIVLMKVTDDAAKIQLMWNKGILLDKSDILYLICWRDRVSSRLDSY